MSKVSKRQIAQKFYDAGYALFQEGKYNEALAELSRAEDVYRRLDARGHPFEHVLSNGISGLANTLYLEGICCQRNGDYRQAITYYETALINSKFEKKKPFQAFLKSLRGNALACYEKELEKAAPETLNAVLSQDPAIDTSYRFPFSLNEDVIPVARLHELAPERYARFRDFYLRAKAQDAEIRRRDKASDVTAVKRMSVYVWGILLAIAAIYIFVVIETLMRNNY